MPASLLGEMEKGTTTLKYVSMPLDKVMDIQIFPKWNRVCFLFYDVTLAPYSVGAP